MDKISISIFYCPNKQTNGSDGRTTSSYNISYGPSPVNMDKI